MDYVRIRWIFEDSVVETVAMPRYDADQIVAEVGHFGLTVDPTSGKRGDGLHPKRSKVIA